MLAYVCIGGVNVDESDARALAELIGDTPVRLDLIDVTDPTGRWHPPAPDEYRRFRDALRTSASPSRSSVAIPAEPTSRRRAGLSPVPEPGGSVRHVTENMS